jgi:anti-sigma factor RsiW
MDCKDVHVVLVPFAEGDLAPRLRRHVEEHLETCYTCQEELREITELLSRARAVLRHPHPRNGFARIREDLQPRQSRTRAWGFAILPLYQTAVLTAASIALVAVSAFFVATGIQVADQFIQIAQIAATSDREAALEIEVGDCTSFLVSWRDRIHWASSISVNPYHANAEPVDGGSCGCAQAPSARPGGLS